jgi:Ser/Thr protein kinase RdoA (MazF antagonist)
VRPHIAGPTATPQYARLTPKFTAAEAEQLARTEYALTAKASALPSERDQNFLLTTAAGKFVLKFAKSDEDRSVLEFQNAALEWVAARAPHLAVPRVRPMRSGATLGEARDRHGRAHYTRLIGYLEGEMYAAVRPHDAALLESLGAVLGELDAALQGFTHPAMHRKLHWDLRHAAHALEHLPLLAPEQQAVVRQFMGPWRELDWRALRHGVIHGDANDHNVLVRDGRVVGLIDFGDMVHSALACEPAIALAYAMQQQPRPLEAAARIVRSYHARLPLSAAEIDALHPLLAARLCMSLCFAAHNARAKSDDPYQQVSAAPAWELMQKLAAVPPDAARAVLREACGRI